MYFCSFFLELPELPGYYLASLEERRLQYYAATSFPLQNIVELQLENFQRIIFFSLVQPLLWISHFFFFFDFASRTPYLVTNLCVTYSPRAELADSHATLTSDAQKSCAQTIDANVLKKWPEVYVCTSSKTTYNVLRIPYKSLETLRYPLYTPIYPCIPLKGGQRLGRFLCQNHPTKSDVTSGWKLSWTLVSLETKNGGSTPNIFFCIFGCHENSDPENSDLRPRKLRALEI